MNSVYASINNGSLNASTSSKSSSGSVSSCDYSSSAKSTSGVFSYIKVENTYSEGSY